MRTIRIGDIPTIKQGNKLFSLSELIGKPIIANETTIAYKFPSEESTLYFLPEDFKQKGSEVIAIEDIDVFKNTGKASENETLTPLYKVKKGKSLGIFDFSRTDKFKRYYLVDKKGKSVFVKMSEEQDKMGIRKSVFVFNNAKPKDNVYYTFNKKDLIGTLFSWVEGITMIKISNSAYNYVRNPEIFLAFKKDNKNYYVPLKPKTIDTTALEQSGAKDEETKQEDNKAWYEKLTDNLASGLKKVVIIGGIAFLVYKIGTFAISETLKNKKNGN